MSAFPLSMGGSLGLAIVIFVAAIVGAPIALGIIASLLTVPGLLTTGYGLVPPRYAPALIRTAVRLFRAN